MKTNMINTNSIKKVISVVVVLIGMSVSAWGTDETFSLGYTLWGTGGGYNSSTGSKNTDASHAVSIAWTDVLKANDKIQLKASTGEIHSTSLPASSSNNKIKSIKITVTTNTINLYCSTDGSNWSNAISYTSGTAKDVSSAGYKYFKITATGSYAVASAVEVVYTQSVALTVTFDKEGGEFDDPSVFINTNQIKEASGGAGITLPLVNPSESAASMGWGFYGWATSAASSSTTTAPTIVGKAGDTYYPASATTLHAVFAKGEYTKETSAITANGKYLIIATTGGHNYVMTNKYSTSGDDGQLAGKLIDETSTNKYSAANVHADYVFTIVTSSSVGVSSGTWMIKNVSDNKYVSADYSDFYITNISEADGNTIALSTGTWTITNVYSSNKYRVYYNSSSNMFCSTTSDATSLLIYKETETPTYCSAPKTVKVVASPAAGGTVEFDDAKKSEVIYSDDDFEDIVNVTSTTSGYEFLYWESSDEDAALFYNDDTKEYDLARTTVSYQLVKATGDAILTAYFYKNCSVTYTLTGLTKLTGVTNVDAATNASGFTATFSLNDHYRTTPLTCVVKMGGETLTEGSGNDYTWDASTKTLTFPAATDITGDLVITITAEHTEYTKYAFSCAELTLTPHLATEETPIFITSTANKTVRSQDYIEITGNGLTPSKALTFPGLPSKFAIKNADGTPVTTDGNGEISANAYIFYTPDAGDTSDGLDKLTGITVSVEGAKPKTVVLTQDIIGRHIPADFVIAAKYNKKWYALPATMETGSTPDPDEIAIDDSHNPGIAYTSANNVYGLEGPSATNISGGNGQYVKLTMSQLTDGTVGEGPAPLYASTSANIGKNGTAGATSDLSAGWWWALTQTDGHYEPARCQVHHQESEQLQHIEHQEQAFCMGIVRKWSGRVTSYPAKQFDIHRSRSDCMGTEEPDRAS